MAVNVNTQKALGGNNPIKLSGNSGGDTNNSIAGWFEAPQQNNPVSMSKFYRRTNKDLTKSNFQNNNNDDFVPDATENATVATSGAISFSDFRGASNQGVIKEYVVTQSGADVNLTLANASWNSNLDKNVPKVANINGRMTSGSAPSGQSHAGYNHKSGAALNFDAEAYNLNIDVDTGTGDNNNFNNATGVFGFGGQGGTTNQTNGNAGGTAMYVRQNSNRSGTSAVIKVNTNSGRLHGGGGGGEGGRGGNNGNPKQCQFFTHKNGPTFNIGGTIRSRDACNNKPKAQCDESRTLHGVTGYPNVMSGRGWRNSSCNGTGGRKRCRGSHRFRGNAGQMGCYKNITKNCKYHHVYTGNTPSGGAGGGGGQGKGGTGPAGAGGAGGSRTLSTCSVGTAPGTTLNPGTKPNNGTSGQAGGGYGQAGGNNTGRSGAGGAAGYALYSPTTSQVDLTNTSNNRGLVS
jgi:hypothetical protein